MARVATDNYNAGRIAADRVGKLLSGKGSVAIVGVVPGGASTEEREGFEDTMHGKYPNIRIVDKRFGMADVARSLRSLKTSDGASRARRAFRLQ